MDMAVMAVMAGTAVTAVMAGMAVTAVMAGMAVMVIGMAVIGAGGAAGGGLVLAST